MLCIPAIGLKINENILTDKIHDRCESDKDFVLWILFPKFELVSENIKNQSSTKQRLEISIKNTVQ